jgi:cation-transporting ATPase 13A3/4/5
MITGDSPQCGIYIAKELGMVPRGTRVLLGDFDPTDATVRWTHAAPTGVSTHDGAAAAAALSGSSIPKYRSGDQGLTTAAMLDAYGPELESGAVELAVTGSAFKMLRQAGLVPRLLYHTRVFGRVKPEGKIMVIDSFVDSGVVIGMCGDGGNDCGALRTAHTGVALSKADASMVSPFTAKTKTVSAVVELLREGRGALHTSIAAYKFLITYGLLFSVLKLSFYYFGVIMCQMAYFMTEGIAIIAIPYAMTLSLPARDLGKRRPSHGLLSGLTTSSTLGLWAINTAFTVGALFYMQASPDYVRWPAKHAIGASWWTMGDNWESTVLFFMTFTQFITSGLVFSFGAGFNRTVLRNWLLCAVWGGLFALTIYLLLSPPNIATFTFHIASQAFNGKGTDSPVWAKYQEAGGTPTPGMSSGFRLGLLGLMLGNVACQALWQGGVAAGPVGDALRKLRPSKRPQFRL